MNVRKVISMALTGISIVLFNSTIIYAQSDSNDVSSISPETAQKAKDYFEILSLITESMNGSTCDQIQRDIRATNTPQNRKKMDFDLSSLPGKVSQQIAQQYKDNIQAFKEANNHYLSVCNASPLARDANTDLHALFKSSVVKADAHYHQMKAEADKANAERAKAEAEAEKVKAKAEAEAERAKAEAERAKAEAEREQAIAAQKRADADKEIARSELARYPHEKMVAEVQRACTENYSGSLEQTICNTGSVCGIVTFKNDPLLSIPAQNTKCLDCCTKLKDGGINLLKSSKILSSCKDFCVGIYQNM